MRPNLKIIAVIAVAAIVIVAYLAFVGVSSGVPNVGVRSDPTGQKREPIAYTEITIQCTVWMSSNAWRGSIDSLTIRCFPWINSTDMPTVNQLFDPLGLLSSDFEGFIKITITGPNNYISKPYSSPMEKVTLTRDIWLHPIGTLEPKGMDFGPYTAKVYDPGQYTASVAFCRMDGDTVNQLDQQIKSFTISATGE